MLNKNKQDTSIAYQFFKNNVFTQRFIAMADGGRHHTRLHQPYCRVFVFECKCRTDKHSFGDTIFRTKYSVQKHLAGHGSGPFILSEPCYVLHLVNLWNADTITIIFLCRVLSPQPQQTNHITERSTYIATLYIQGTDWDLINLTPMTCGLARSP